MKNFFSYLAYYFSVLLLFLVDLMTVSFLEHPGFSIIRAVYYTELLRPVIDLRIFFVGLLLLLETFIYSGIFGLDLIILVPLTILLCYFKSVVNTMKVTHFISIVASFVIHTLLIDCMAFSSAVSHVLSLTGIGINFIIIIILLKYIFRGSQGDRSMG